MQHLFGTISQLIYKRHVYINRYYMGKQRYLLIELHFDTLSPVKDG